MNITKKKVKKDGGKKDTYQEVAYPQPPPEAHHYLLQKQPCS
jgi:hypothetical protein